MDLVRHELRLNLLEVGNQGTVNVRQGDKDTHLLVVHLVKGPSPYLLPTDGSVIVVVCAEKPDGTFIVDSPASVVEGAVHYFMDEQFFTAPGIAKCELVVYSKNGEILYSPHFSTFTEKTSVDVEKIESKDKFKAFDQAMSDARTITNKWSNPYVTLKPGTQTGATAQILPNGVQFDMQLNPDDFDVAGIPYGGSAGQVLLKKSNSPFDAAWSTLDYVPNNRTINGKPLLQNINLSAQDVGAADSTIAEDVAALRESLNNIPKISVDINPTKGSSNPVSSGGVFNALDEKVPVSRKINEKSLSEDVQLTPKDIGAVPTDRKINGKSLSEDVQLTPKDIGALPADRKINGKALSSDIELNYLDVGAVTVTRRVNGHFLTKDIVLTSEDVGAAPHSLVAEVEALKNSGGGSGSGSGGTGVNIPVDSKPTHGSSNAVSSGGVYTALQDYVPKTLTINDKPLDDNLFLTAEDVWAVPPGRTITKTGKDLRKNIEINASDVGAVPVDRKINGWSLSEDRNLTANDVGAVPKTRKINNKPLDRDVSLTPSDIGLEFDSAPTPGSLNLLTSNVIYQALQQIGAVKIEFDWLPTKNSSKAVYSGGVYDALESYVPNTRKINGRLLAGDVNLSPVDVGAIPNDTRINGRLLYGGLDLTADDVGAAPKSLVAEVEALKNLGSTGGGLTPELTFDAEPTQNSTNLVSSGSVFNFVARMYNKFPYRELMWSYGSGSANFPAQSIAVENLGRYKFYEAVYVALDKEGIVSVNSGIFSLLDGGNNLTTVTLLSSDNVPFVARRSVSASIHGANAVVTFGDASKIITGQEVTIDNELLLPIEIYGVEPLYLY